MDASTQPQRTVRSIGTRAIGAVVALALVLTVGYVVSRSGSTQGLDLKPAPDFTTTLYSGGTGEFTLSDQLGHPVVLNFWGSWCPPCRFEFPTLQHAADQYKDDGLVVFGVNAGGIVRDSERDAKEFLAQQGTTFFTGPDLGTDQIAIDYRVSRFPTTFFLTPDGKIYKKWGGQITDTQLMEILEELMAL